MSKQFTVMTISTFLTMVAAPALGQPPKDLVDTADKLFNLLEPKMIFVTSETYTGDLVTEANSALGTSFSGLQGLEAADALCQNLADAEGSIVPVGEYVALLSTDDVQAGARLTPSSGPYLRPDGIPVAANYAALFGTISDIGQPPLGNLINPVQLDEAGIQVFTKTWTGTAASGRGALGNCDNWTNSGLSLSVIAGNPFFGESIWLNWVEENDCGSEYHLYCVKR